jgi:hypothetical protein
MPAVVLVWVAPISISQAQSSPFMTGATALQMNLLAWLTPIAIILVMTLGAMAMANRLILRCSGSEHGGTSQFASRLIGEREVVRRQVARAHDRGGWFAAGTARRSTTFSRQQTIETAVLAAEIEQLPDLSGFLKTAASPAWLRVTVRRRG